MDNNKLVKVLTKMFKEKEENIEVYIKDGKKYFGNLTQSYELTRFENIISDNGIPYEVLIFKTIEKKPPYFIYIYSEKEVEIGTMMVYKTKEDRYSFLYEYGGYANNFEQFKDRIKKNNNLDIILKTVELIESINNKKLIRLFDKLSNDKVFVEINKLRSELS